MSWEVFAASDPGLATAGAGRLSDGYAFLATTRQDGSPRVHPISPLVGKGHLFVFMDPFSPKGHDLRREDRYALHSAVGGPEEGYAEFLVTGRAVPVEDPDVRGVASDLARYPPPDRDVLFEFSVERAILTVYESGETVRRRWKRGSGQEGVH